MSIYHTAQCVLHRPFLHRARENPRYLYSHHACIESSMELLRFQFILHSISGPNGLRHGVWHSGSFSPHNFLMASTIIALDLYHAAQSPGWIQDGIYARDTERQLEMLAALKRSRSIWDEMKNRSMDAWKAAVILGLLLERLNEKPRCRDPPYLEQAVDAQHEKESAAITLGLLSTGMSQVSSTSPLQVPDNPPKFEQNDPLVENNIESLDQPLLSDTSLGMFAQMPDIQPFNVDWVCLSLYGSPNPFSNLALNQDGNRSNY